jgi:hypothetical protein
MTFDHDYGCSFPLFSSLLRKEGTRKGEGITKIVIKRHAFLLDHFHNLVPFYLFERNILHIRNFWATALDEKCCPIIFTAIFLTLF